MRRALWAKRAALRTIERRASGPSVDFRSLSSPSTRRAKVRASSTLISSAPRPGMIAVTPMAARSRRSLSLKRNESGGSPIANPGTERRPSSQPSIRASHPCLVKARPMFTASAQAALMWPVLTVWSSALGKVGGFSVPERVNWSGRATTMRGTARQTKRPARLLRRSNGNSLRSSVRPTEGSSLAQSSRSKKPGASPASIGTLNRSRTCASAFSSSKSAAEPNSWSTSRTLKGSPSGCR
jgi:hypothetical protein